MGNRRGTPSTTRSTFGIDSGENSIVNRIIDIFVSFVAHALWLCCETLEKWKAMDHDGVKMPYRHS